MKPGVVIAAIVGVAAIAFAIFMIDVDMTDEASLPNVDVNVEGGDLPEFDAEVGDVDVGSKDVTVTVPTVDVVPPEDEQVAENK